MVSFELGKEVKKDVFRLITSVEQRKKNLSPHKGTQGAESEGLRFDSSWGIRIFSTSLASQCLLVPFSTETKLQL